MIFGMLFSMSPSGGARPGAGRKPLPPSERRDAKLLIAVTRAELRDLKQAARAAGLPPATYVREMLARHLRRRREK